MEEIDFYVWALDIENNTFERKDFEWYIHTCYEDINIKYEENKSHEAPKVSIQPQPLLDFLNEYIEQLRGEIKAEDEEDGLVHYRKRLAECENLRLKAQLMIEHYEDERQEQETACPSFLF
ncbi:hypothetical protein P5U49_000860 [Neisseria gonorrhoeae]